MSCRAFFNLHFHADKCLLGEIMRPNVSGTLPEAIEITNDLKRNYDPAEVASRAVRTIEIGVMNGTTFFRLFATSARSAGSAARGLLLAREKMKDYAPSRSSHSRKKALCAIRAPPN